MQIERRDNIVYFNNDEGVTYGYILRTSEGYRMAWYAGIVMPDAEMREAVAEITKFLNYVVVS